MPAGETQDGLHIRNKAACHLRAGFEGRYPKSQVQSSDCLSRMLSLTLKS